MRPGENEIIGLDPRGEAGDGDVEREDRGGDHWQKETKEAHQACGDARERARAAYDGVHPAEQEARGGAESAAEVGVLAAGFGDGGA